MKPIAKFMLAFVLCSTFAVQAFDAETTGVTLNALGCKINIPDGYFLSPANQGVIQASYSGNDFSSNPAFHYFPGVSLDDHVSKTGIYYRVLSEERLGELRFLKVKFDVGSSHDLTWDVITSDSAFFESWAFPGGTFLDQFRECATGSSNESLVTDTSDAA